MPNYIVNTNKYDGHHEVHETFPTACGHLPDKENRDDLGWHSDCHKAVNEAESKGYDPVDGCRWCCEPCHTR